MLTIDLTLSQIRLELIVGEDRRTQNHPTNNEIAAIIPNEYSDTISKDTLTICRKCFLVSGNSLLNESM